MKKLLNDLNACREAILWAESLDYNWPKIYKKCHRGDWLLWLFERTNPGNIKLKTLVAGHCANTVRHLMTDPRSTAAVDAAIAFGEGKIDEDELKIANLAANAAYTNSANSANAAAAYAAYAAAAYNIENLKITADIVRKHIPIEKFQIEIK